MDAAGVLAKIHAAFPEQPLPEVTLRQAQLSDQSMSRQITEDEWLVEGAKYRGVVWSQIDEHTLRECDASLAHLDNDNFVYYLPAFLCAALRQLAAGNADSDDLVGGTVFAVCHTTSNYALSRLKRLTDAQIDAVIAFLHVIRVTCQFNGKEADVALTSYWETPESRRRTLIYVP